MFLTRLAALSGAAASITLPSAYGETPNSFAAFDRGRTSNPLLAGFDNAPGDLDFPDLLVEGKLPEGLSGIFYRNGPGQHALGGERYQHWFDGDGYLHRWQIGEGRVAFKGRFAATPKRLAEQAAGKFLYPASGGGVPAREGISGPDGINVANTNLLPVKGGLWGLWEGGSALRLDPVTLKASGFVSLRDDFDGAPFSAHPRFGEDGRIWNIGTMGERLAIYRLKSDGALDAAKVHTIPSSGLIHDFLLTCKSVVVILSSTRVEGSAADGLFNSIKGRPDLSMQVKVYDRESLTLIREAELPAGYVFHFGNAHEDDTGTLRFDMAYSTNCDAVQAMRAPMLGKFPDSSSQACLVTLPGKGAPKLEPVKNDIEFPRINPLYTARRHQFVYAAAQSIPGKSLWFDAVAKLDLDTGKQACAYYGEDWLVEEHVFVPKRGGSGEDDGWLLGTALNWKLQKTALNILDARDPCAGPLARIWLDQPLPLGFHGQFVHGA
jgi:carotenoid cleavage dioxygenase